MRRLAFVIGIGMAAIACAGSAWAQGFQGGLRGAIKDAGGAVPAATVTLTNEATNLARSALTNAEGEYAFAAVEPGTYKVKVSLQGYKTIERSGVRIGTQTFLVLDQTRPDIEAPVVRVIVPGLRHFYRRFGPGRLYDVPVKLGWLEKPLKEDELNPMFPHT